MGFFIKVEKLNFEMLLVAMIIPHNFLISPYRSVAVITISMFHSRLFLPVDTIVLRH